MYNQIHVINTSEIVIFPRASQQGALFPFQLTMFTQNECCEQVLRERSNKNLYEPIRFDNLISSLI